tara:strand:+ start:120 stop:695 length:576 start_codon:yes stop_codon:yes gene_type:complete
MAVGAFNSLTYLAGNVVYNWAAADVEFTMASLNNWMTPTSFKHLRLHFRDQHTAGTNQMGSTYNIVLNGDTTTTNYYETYLYTTTGGSSLSMGQANQADIMWRGGYFYRPSGTENTYGTKTLNIMDFYNWNSSTLKKIVRQTRVQMDKAANSYGGVSTLMWNSTAAITTVKFDASSNYIRNGCTFDWYGFN